MTYGERLRELRAERRLSLRQVEERGGPNKDTMSLIERDVHKPHPQTLGRIAEALELSVSELRAELEGAERPLGQAPPEPRLEGAERRTARDYQVGQAEAFFVPLEEGEEEEEELCRPPFRHQILLPIRRGEVRSRRWSRHHASVTTLSKTRNDEISSTGTAWLTNAPDGMPA